MCCAERKAARLLFLLFHFSRHFAKLSSNVGVKNGLTLFPSDTRPTQPAPSLSAELSWCQSLHRWKVSRGYELACPVRSFRLTASVGEEDTQTRLFFSARNDDFSPQDGGSGEEMHAHFRGSEFNGGKKCIVSVLLVDGRHILGKYLVWQQCLWSSIFHPYFSRILVQ